MVIFFTLHHNAGEPFEMFIYVLTARTWPNEKLKYTVMYCVSFSGRTRFMFSYKYIGKPLIVVYVLILTTKHFQSCPRKKKCTTRVKLKLTRCRIYNIWGKNCYITRTLKQQKPEVEHKQATWSNQPGGKSILLCLCFLLTRTVRWNLVELLQQIYQEISYK